MMSKECNEKKRCIVKRLNFEDCVVTNVKAKGKGLVKMRAQIYRKVEDPFSNQGAEKKLKTSDSQVEKLPDELSPILSQKSSRPRILKSSPVLAKKRLKMPGSPVFANKKRQLSEKIVRHDSESVTLERIRFESNKTSPVFRRPRVKRSPDLFVACDSVKVSPRLPSLDLIDSQGSSQFLIESSSSQEPHESNEMVIESFGESSQNTSGTESEILKQKSESQSENTLKVSNLALLKTPEKSNKETEKINPEIFDSGKKRKKFKKNSLSARLEKLKKQQISERRIWEHEKDIMKANRNIVDVLSVVFFWKDGSLFIIKCRSIEDINQDIILILHGDAITDIHKIKEKSIICISPPWQKINLPKSNCTIILSAVCIEIKEELEFPASHKVVKVPIEDEKCKNQDFLTNCLFSF